MVHPTKEALLDCRPSSGGGGAVRPCHRAAVESGGLAEGG
jgi:hypothetical protein